MSDQDNTASAHLEEVTTKERIDLIQDDSVRRWGQIIIAFILVGVMIGYLLWYAMWSGEATQEFRLSLAQDMRVLIIMGVGAALAIFGLGRTVGKK